MIYVVCKRKQKRKNIARNNRIESKNRKRSAGINSQPCPCNNFVSCDARCRSSVSKANARNLGIILPWLFMQMGARRLNVSLSVAGARRTLVGRFRMGNSLKSTVRAIGPARPRFFENYERTFLFPPRCLDAFPLLAKFLLTFRHKTYNIHFVYLTFIWSRWQDKRRIIRFVSKDTVLLMQSR